MYTFLSQVRRLPREIRLYLAYSLFANIGLGVFVLIYNLYLLELSLQEDFIGTFNAVQTVAVGLMALTMGPLINRFGTWRCITYGTTFFLASSAGLALLTDPTLLLIASTFMGAGFSFLLVPAMPFIAEWSEPEHRPAAAALTFSLTSVAMTAGSLLGGWSPRLVAAVSHLPAESVGAYRFTLLAGIALAVIGLAPMWRMRGSVPPTTFETAAPRLEAERRAWHRQARQDIVFFVLAGLFMSLGAGAVIPFFNVFLVDLGMRAGRIGMIFSVAGIVAAIVGLFAPALARRVGPLAALLIVRLSPAPLYLLLALSPGTGVAIVAHVVRTTSINMAWPIDSTFVAEILPPKARAFAFSLRAGAWNLGFAVSSLIAGQTIVARGYEATFLTYALFSSLSAVTFVGYFARHPRRRKVREPAPLDTAPAS